MRLQLPAPNPVTHGAAGAAGLFRKVGHREVGEGIVGLNL